jgi:PST family polysaccharide transporter
MFMSAALGIALGAIAFFTAPLIFTPLFGEPTADLVQLSTPMFVVAGVVAVPLAMLQRRLDFRMISLLQILAGLVGAAVSVGLAIAGLDGAALVLGGLAGSAASMLVALVVARPPWPRLQLQAAREIARFGVPAALAGLSWTGFRNADFAIIGARLGAVGAGYYWRSYQFAIEYQRKIGSAVHQIAFPVYSRAGDLQAMLALRERVVRTAASVLIPGLAALAVLAPVLIPWMIGPVWEPAVVPTQILCVAGMVTVLSDTMGAVVLAAGRANAWLAYHLGCFLVYAPAVYFAAGRGLEAVCAAVVAVQALSTLAAYGLLLRGLVERPLKCLWNDAAAPTAAALATVAATAPLTSALDGWGAPAPVTLAVAGLVGVVAAAAALRLASPAAWRDLSGLARRVIPRRPRRREPVPVPLAAAD